jgi:hypothetical protein
VHRRDIVLLLLLGAKIADHQRLNEIANNRAFILQVVVQPQPLGGEMFANTGHCEMRSVLAAKFGRQCIAIMPRLVGNLTHFAKQIFPFLAWQSVIVPIGSGMFAAMVKEPDIVVALFDRLDFARDEFIQLGKIVGYFLGNFEQHFRLHLSRRMRIAWQSPPHISSAI